MINEILEEKVRKNNFQTGRKDMTKVKEERICVCREEVERQHLKDTITVSEEDFLMREEKRYEKY